jgi:hypothetical protein
MLFYLCLIPTDGQAVASDRNPINPETVFVAVTPSAPPLKFKFEC